MQLAPNPPDEAERLAALRAYDILDTQDEPSFDRLTKLASKLFDVPIAIVGLIDAERQWFKSCVGLDGKESPRDLTFCSHAILSREPLVIQDARQDLRFADNPAVTGPPHVRFYAGAPLHAAGYNLGTLCIVDSKPRLFSDGQRKLLSDLAALVVDEMELRLGARARFLLEKVASTTPNYFYVIDLSRRALTWANFDLRAWLGYPKGPADGFEFRSQIIHPDDRPRVLERYTRGSFGDRDEAEAFSYRLRDANGQYRWFMFRERTFERNLSGDVTHIVGVATDISAQRQVQEDLERSQADLSFRMSLMQNVFDSVVEGICVATKAEIVGVNRAAERLTGIRPGPAEQWLATRRAFHADGVTPIERHEVPLLRAINGETIEHMEMVLQGPTMAAPIRMEVSARPLPMSDGGQPTGVMTFRDVTALHAARDELSRLALTDEMTGLPNLRALRERLLQMVLEAERGRRFALLMIDVDHFKQVNDTYGHDGGDDVLRRVARTLQTSIRRLDLAARYGGEEFCVLYSGDIDAETAMLLADRLRLAVADSDGPVRVTVSVGVCVHSGGRRGLDGDGMLHAADAALYRAKRAGRNRVQLAE